MRTELSGKIHAINSKRLPARPHPVPVAKLHDADFEELDALMTLAWDCGLAAHNKMAEVERMLSEGAVPEGNLAWDALAKKVVPNATRTAKSG
jgi:hypothetical protein